MHTECQNQQWNSGVLVSSPVITTRPCCLSKQPPPNTWKNQFTAEMQLPLGWNTAPGPGLRQEAVDILSPIHWTVWSQEKTTECQQEPKFNPVPRYNNGKARQGGCPIGEDSGL
ncbi:unnamed protein product [Lepidochelys kempii]